MNCLLVSENESPLNMALDRLLSSNPGINVVKWRPTNYQGLIDEICKLKAQLVVLDEFSELAAQNSLTQLLMYHPTMRVIVVQHSTNQLHVFRKDEVMLQSSSDLLAIIESI